MRYILISAHFIQLLFYSIQIVHSVLKRSSKDTMHLPCFTRKLCKPFIISEHTMVSYLYLFLFICYFLHHHFVIVILFEFFFLYLITKTTDLSLDTCIYSFHGRPPQCVWTLCYLNFCLYLKFLIFLVIIFLICK